MNIKIDLRITNSAKNPSKLILNSRLSPRSRDAQY
jgi:hypothetical protein